MGGAAHGPRPLRPRDSGVPGVSGSEIGSGALADAAHRDATRGCRDGDGRASSPLRHRPGRCCGWWVPAQELASCPAVGSRTKQKITKIIHRDCGKKEFYNHSRCRRCTVAGHVCSSLPVALLPPREEPLELLLQQESIVPHLDCDPNTVLSVYHSVEPVAWHIPARRDRGQKGGHRHQQQQQPTTAAALRVSGGRCATQLPRTCM